MFSSIQQQSTVMFGVVWLFIFIAFLLVLFVVGLLLCIWVYRDAQKRGMNGVLWLIIILLTNIIGLIIYLVVRESETIRGTAQPYPQPVSSSTLRYCKYCGNLLSPDAKFCSRCGKEQTLVS